MLNTAVIVSHMIDFTLLVTIKLTVIILMIPQRTERILYSSRSEYDEDDPAKKYYRSPIETITEILMVSIKIPL